MIDLASLIIGIALGFYLGIFGMVLYLQKKRHNRFNQWRRYVMTKTRSKPI